MGGRCIHYSEQFVSGAGEPRACGRSMFSLLFEISVDIRFIYFLSLESPKTAKGSIKRTRAQICTCSRLSQFEISFAGPYFLQSSYVFDWCCSEIGAANYFLKASFVRIFNIQLCEKYMDSRQAK